MNINDIPVHVVGPGSQPAEPDPLSYIDMPKDMQTFTPTYLDDPEAFDDLPDAREAMNWLKASLDAAPSEGTSRLADLSGLDAASREIVNQVLGEGEVSLTVNGSVAARCQESVLAGVWRTVLLDADGDVGRDLLEVSAVPTIVAFASETSKPVDTSVPENAAEIPNALPILIELESAVAEYAASGSVHSINLSLLPLSEEEIEFIDARLGRGPVDILSRSYGKCQIISTATANVWWVRYYNSMGTPILNSLEVVDVPEVVKAAREDLADSASRLREILAPYRAAVA
ncbi:MAG: hydrogenase expression/formation protein [Pseudomonadota bacterium]